MMKKFLKVILVFVLILVVGVGFSILTQEKGEWVCENGQWVKFGEPREPSPSWSCERPKEKKIEQKKEKQKPAGIPLDDFQISDSEDQRLFPAGFKE